MSHLVESEHERSATILYSVQGYGYGHAMRSRTIIGHLSNRKHRVVVTANLKAHAYLSQALDATHDVRRLDGFPVRVNAKGRVDYLASVLAFLFALPFVLLRNAMELYRVHKAYRPSLVITDFEPCASLYAFLFRIPCISLDHGHVLTHARHRHEKRGGPSGYLFTSLLVRLFVPYANLFIISHFAGLESKYRQSTLVPPIVRDEVLNAVPSNGSHIIVYMWGEVLPPIVDELKKLPDVDFVVYGLDRDGQDGNVSFRRFSARSFVEDLASAAGVIAGGGYSFLCEALHCGKPVLIVPMNGQFEQVLNGRLLTREGYGASVEQFDSTAVRQFIHDLPRFRARLVGYNRQDNQVAFRELDRALMDLLPSARQRDPDRSALPCDSDTADIAIGVRSRSGTIPERSRRG